MSTKRKLVRHWWKLIRTPKEDGKGYDPDWSDFKNGYITENKQAIKNKEAK